MLAQASSVTNHSHSICKLYADCRRKADRKNQKSVYERMVLQMHHKDLLSHMDRWVDVFQEIGCIAFFRKKHKQFQNSTLSLQTKSILVCYVPFLCSTLSLQTKSILVCYVPFLCSTEEPNTAQTASYRSMLHLHFAWQGCQDGSHGDLPSHSDKTQPAVTSPM